MTEKSKKLKEPENWPDEWPEWVKSSMDKMHQTEEDSGVDLPENAPKWVDRVLEEFVKLTVPTVKFNNLGQESGVGLLAKTIGHQVWMNIGEYGMEYQCELAEPILEEASNKLKEKLGEEKYKALVKKSEPLIAKIGSAIDSFEAVSEKKSKIIAEVIKLASEQSVEDQVEFFSSYDKALRKPVFDKGGRPAAEKYSSRTNILFLTLTFWETVALMRTRLEFYQWLCRLLGESQVGEFERVDKICDRLKIRFAKVVRPKNLIPT